VHLHIGDGDSSLRFGVEPVHREHERRIAERDEDALVSEAALEVAMAEVTHEQVESRS
jgi:hypothetical protein